MDVGTRIIRAPRGSALSCKGWPQVYGGSGKAARNWQAYDAIVAELRRLDHDERLLIQSGKPVGVFRTHTRAPLVLIANALLVLAWATWETFRDLEDRGLTMYGQMTAGSWIYVGTQGILQGLYETFAAAARRHFVVEVDRDRIARRRATGSVDESTPHLEEALDTIEGRRRHRIARSIALEANAAGGLPESLQRDVIPDVVTDQTPAHDALNGCVPHGMSLAEAAVLRERHPQQYVERAMAQARDAGVKNAFDIPGFVPEHVRPLFCEGKGPFRWAALSGDPDDIRVTDEAALDMFPDHEPLCRWMRERVPQERS